MKHKSLQFANIGGHVIFTAQSLAWECCSVRSMMRIPLVTCLRHTTSDNFLCTFPAVIADVDTDLNITFSVKPNGLHIEYEGLTYTNKDVMSISLRAHEALQISANVDLTGIVLLMCSILIQHLCKYIIIITIGSVKIFTCTLVRLSFRSAVYSTLHAIFCI